MVLLERDDALAALTAAVVDAGRDRGAVVLVTGEAGIGKSAVVARFAEEQRAGMRTLVAGCEALHTPRPFGPLVDLAAHLPPRIAQALHSGEPYSGLFPDLLAWLREAPTLVVLEDLHWADAATLDLVRYVGRRIASVSAALVLTYRDDEIGIEHPLRQVLGSLPKDHTRRIALAPLTEAAVHQLAHAAGRDAGDVFRITAGNPFYVTELLSSPPGLVPASVRDAVLARLGTLSPAARAIAEWASVVPQAIERDLLAKLVACDAAALDEAQVRGMLVADGSMLRFRHELARSCVEQWIAAERRAQMHGAVFAQLGRRADAEQLLARRVHHAQQAGLVDAVVELAPRAARAAAQASAHRDAAALLGLALRHADRLPHDVLVELLEARATECTLIQALDDAAAARERALAVHRARGDRRAQGWNLTRLATLRITRPEALDYSDEAVALLEQLEPGRELAWACADRAAVLTARARATDALAWGRRGLALAEQVGEPEVLAHALNICGAVELSLDYNPDALARLERSLELAQAHGLPHKVALAYLNLAGMALINHDYQRLLGYAERGLDFASGRDLDFIVAGLRLRRMFGWFDLGRWREVHEELDRLEAMPMLLPRERNTVRLWRGRMQALTGVANDAAEWRELHALGVAAQTELRPAAVASVCAEAAWLRGETAGAQRIVVEALPGAVASGEPWILGGLAAWALRCGAAAPDVAVPIAPLYRQEMAGEWRAAAAVWQDLGCAYERAVVLLGGDETAMHEALSIFEALGATPLCAMARRRLRGLGARGLRRGPYQAARTDPLGLTRREREVLDLLLAGHSNAAIADRLHRSERTIEHHVAGIFDKLGVTSRAGLRALCASMQK